MKTNHGSVGLPEASSFSEPPAIATDGKRRVVFLNPAAERLLGVRKKDVLGSELSSVLSNEALDTARAFRDPQDPGRRAARREDGLHSGSRGRAGRLLPPVEAGARDRRAPRRRVGGPQHRGASEPVARDGPKSHSERPAGSSRSTVRSRSWPSRSAAGGSIARNPGGTRPLSRAPVRPSKRWPRMPEASSSPSIGFLPPTSSGRLLLEQRQADDRGRAALRRARQEDPAAVSLRDAPSRPGGPVRFPDASS